MSQKTILQNLLIFVKLDFQFVFSRVLIPTKCSVPPSSVVSSFKPKLEEPGVWRVSIKSASDLPPEAQMLQLLEDGNCAFVLSAPEPVQGFVFGLLPQDQDLPSPGCLFLPQQSFSSFCNSFLVVNSSCVKNSEVLVCCFNYIKLITALITHLVV